MKIKNLFLLLVVVSSVTISTYCRAQSKNQILPAVGMPADPKVPILWYRYYDTKGLYEIMQKIAKAYPKLAKLNSVGKSYQGRDIWCLTITDFSNGLPDEKPGIYLDGNIHGNEIQGAEFSLYTAWYLTEMASSNTVIKELLRNKIFYILPSINPDARDHFIHVAGDRSAPRYSMKMNDDHRISQDVTNDRFDNWSKDLDGDGHLTYIRKPSTTKDQYIVNPARPWQMLQMLRKDTPGKVRYEMINEGIVGKREDTRDNNLYDLNRNWYWWFGAQDSSKFFSTGGRQGKIAFPQKEQQVVRDFFLSHPNICVAESFHNAAGSFIRARAVRYLTEDSTDADRIDEQVYDTFGKKAEEICPGYEYHEGEYVGGSSQRTSIYSSISWMYGARGVYAFIPELYQSLYSKYHKTSETDSVERMFKAPVGSSDWYSAQRIMSNLNGRFMDEILFGDAYIPWHKISHPTLGEVEVGGEKKTSGRIHPGFQIQEEAHRQMAFTLYMAMRTAKVEIVNTSIKPLGNNKQEVIVVIRNTGMLPTHTGPDLKHGIIPPDLITINNVSKIIEVKSSSSLPNTGNEIASSVKVPNIPGNGEISVTWIVEGKGDYSVFVKSVRGGTTKQLIKL